MDFIIELPGRGLKLLKAIKSYIKALEYNPNDTRAKSELVLLYLQNDQYLLALDLAKDVYNKQKNNPINANNYLNCLFYKDKSQVNLELINDILARLYSNTSQRAREMYCSAKAKSLAKFEGQVDEAFDLIEQGIIDFPDIKYPVLTLCDLSIQYRKLDKLKRAIEILEKSDSPKSQTYGSFIRYKATYLTLNNKYEEAVALCNKELDELNTNELEVFFEKLKQFQPSNGK
ncbi:hypothetical protein [Pantoea agglomerans]|uniref:tetratricopeptide repeat protein n=1 Tax=Enterobacter agglomerans TaxID=549 RepID=UPI0032093941